LSRRSGRPVDDRSPAAGAIMLLPGELEPLARRPGLTG
jgi:hypothetical protein